MLRIVGILTCILGGLILGDGPAFSETFPSRPIKLVVPYPPGGGVDLMGRIVAERLTEILGVPVVVTHQPGGGGIVGSDAVMRSTPDGYTLLFQASVFLFAAQVTKNTPYDPVTDFTPIAYVSDVPIVLVVNPQLPVKSVGDLVSLMRAKPADFNIAVSALGAAGHLTTLSLLRYVNASPSPEIILYRGTGLGLTDVISGTAHLMTETIGVLMPQVKSGRVRGLAVTGKQRSPLAPEIPTIAEAGGPDLDIVSWYGVWGPKGLPEPIAQRLSKSLEEMVASEAYVSRLKDLGITPRYKDMATFKTFVEAEARWGAELLQAVNVKPTEKQ